ncbi:MAG: hypothetical protein E7672_00210, partial [Ruminococcaceae bacterium]|nr:hypothetical protein [Oscillospiraceae bacterium]
MRKIKKTRRRTDTTVYILLGIMIVLCAVIVFLGMAYFSQMRLNQFSKNITFSDNYFLRNYSYVHNENEVPRSKEYYTFNEAVEIVKSLLDDYGVQYDTFDMEIFYHYHPDRELTETDIFGYYYNIIRSISDSHNGTGYFLFSEHIENITGMSHENDDYTYPRELVLDQIAKIVKASFEWAPGLFIDKYGTIRYDFSEYGGYIHEEMEVVSYVDPAYYERITTKVNNVLYEAERLMATSEAYGAEYNFDSIARLYYDSVAAAYFPPIEYILSTEEILNEISGDEYGTIKLKILDAEHISQLPEYPNGCEAVSAVMMLRYFGFDIDKTDFIDNYLEKEEVDIRWGIRFG